MLSDRCYIRDKSLITVWEAIELLYVGVLEGGGSYLYIRLRLSTY